MGWRVLDWFTSDHKPFEISATLARPLAYAGEERLKARWNRFNWISDSDASLAEESGPMSILLLLCLPRPSKAPFIGRFRLLSGAIVRTLVGGRLLLVLSGLASASVTERSRPQEK